MVSLAVATLIGVNVAIAADGYAGSPIYIKDSNNISSITHQDIVDLTNQDRLNTDVSPLQEDFSLDVAAMAKAQDMLANNYFDHYSPAGTAPWDFMLAAGYDYHFAGENLAMDFSTSDGVNTAWLNSPKHAKNIYNPNYTNIGVAIINGKINNKETTLVVQMFGAKQASIFASLDLSLVNTISSLLGLN